MKGYPFEISLPTGFPISGVVLVDQVKSLDWQKREAEFIGKLDEITIEENTGLLEKIIEV